ncbi:MAG TPA: SusC/RagA family TonB-linked outer membrane protein [Longimicrobiales bacterium]
MSRLKGVFTLVLMAALWLLAPDSAAAQQGVISGRITDAETGAPIGGAQVLIVGTNISVATNSDGAYMLRGVTPGNVTVRVLIIGYGEETQQVAVAAGQTATANFELRSVAIALNPMVVTATGEQRRVEVGNAIAHVDASRLTERTAVSNFADLMTARAAGVQVIPGTQTGAGVRFRIRGTSSLSLANDPIFIIDGVRVEGTTGSMSIGVGGTTPARINDINPEEIESIEIVRGPSAATLYGTDAAKGVVVIQTKRGIAGRPQWSYYTEQTAIVDMNEYPDAYWGWRTGTTASTTSTRSNSVQCFLFQVVTGVCAQDSVTVYNLHEDDEATPFGTGYRQQHGLQLRGGSEAVRYFVHGEWEDETGSLKVPEFDRRWLAARNITLRPEQERPNALNRVTARTNLDVNLSESFDFSVNAGYTTQNLRLPRSDDSGVPGVATNTYGGPGYKYMLNAAGDTLHGWRTVTPREIYRTTTEQDIQRFIGSVGTNWRPQGWLAVRANFGLDYINRKDTQLCRFSECPVSGTDHLGFKEDNRTNFFIYTLDAAASATRSLTSDIEGKTVLGVQYYQSVFDRNGAEGRELPPGATTIDAGAVTSADETSDESRTMGAFLEQQVAIRDRLFLTAAIRSDRNSAFGADFKTVFYPKFSVSWVVSDEPFFPTQGWLSQLRLRTAYGASGVQPGTTAAVEFYTTATALGEAGEASGLVYSAVGNRELKPERSTELELGVDGTFLDDRLSAEITYYTKTSRDQLISRILAPSMGTGSTSRFENLGEVHNWGWEAMIQAQLVRTARFGWDVQFNGSTNSNELVSLGGEPNIIHSSSLQSREGYPLYGWWARKLLDWEDKDGDGLIRWHADNAISEISVSDTAEYHGYSLPKHEFAASTGVDLFDGRVRLFGMMDYRGGHLVYNNSERIRCASRNNCAGLIDPNSSHYEQARTVMVRVHPSRSVAGFFEEGDFLRLREVGVTVVPPSSWTRLLRTRSVSASLAARNLGILWTKYTGVDPEAFGTTGNAPSSFQAFAPPTYFTFRLNLGF